MPPPSTLAVRRVIDVSFQELSFTYLVQLEDMSEHRLSSQVAKQICPQQILNFYSTKCIIIGNQLVLPARNNTDNPEQN